MHRSSENPGDIVYFHSERGSIDGSSNKLIVDSENLIDFFLHLFTRFFRSYLFIPYLKNPKNSIYLTIPRRTQVINLDFPQPEEPILRKVAQTIKFLSSLLGRPNLSIIRSCQYSASAGLEFGGIVFGFVRTVICRRKHSFIIRGDRIATVKESARSSLNKTLVLARLQLYKLSMHLLLLLGHAEIWFQGNQQYEHYRKKYGHLAPRRIFLLNAVLRDMTFENDSNSNSKAYDVIFVGRITKEKGIFDLIASIRLMRDDDTCPRVLIVGDGPQKPQAQQLVAELHLENAIRFAGFIKSRTAISEFLRQSKVFVLPSYTEGMPRSLLEAMFLRTPVVATAVGGIPYLIKDAFNGFIVKKKSPELLKIKILHVLSLYEKETYLKRILDQAAQLSEAYRFSNRASDYIHHSICRGDVNRKYA